MFRRYSIFFFTTLLLACSDSDDPSDPESESCRSELSSGLVFGESYVYTGDLYTITGTKFCKEELVSMLLNDMEVSFIDELTTKISFKIPQDITTDSVALKFKTKTATIDLKKKIAVYPGGGVWTGIQPFPGEARNFAQVAVANNKAYVSGGNRYTGYTNETYNYTNYNDLYEYDPTTNAWTFVLNNDLLKNKNRGIGWNNTLFLFSYSASSTVTTISADSKAFGETKTYTSTLASDVIPFTLGDNLYGVVGENSVRNIVIRKYDTTDKSWKAVQSTPFTDGVNQYDGNFAFEHDGIAYLGWNALNSDDIEFWSYEATANKLTKINSITLTTTNAIALTYLFTLNDLAYFVESGYASINPTSSKLDIIPSKLYIYNFKAKAWRESYHTYPEPFYKSTAFEINEKGYAGFGISSGAPVFIYSNKFYQFTPK